MKKKLIFLFVLISILSACKKESLSQYQMTSFDAGFDTIFTLNGFAYSQEEFTSYFQLMEKESFRYHMLFDKYNEYDGINNIYTINQNAGKQAVKVDSEIIELLLLAKEWHEKTDGVFDVTLGSVLTIWHEYRTEGVALNKLGEYGKIPSKEQLEEASLYTGWDYIEINEIEQTVYITHEAVSLDVGAIAKGYAVEKLAIILEEAGLKYAVLNGGGNIRTINHKADHSPWKVGIKEPDTMVNESIDAFSLTISTSVVTSGDYDRYYIGEGDVHLHHIIDPRTLMPSENSRSVSIVYPNSGISDILSTVLTVLDFDDGVAFVNQYNSENPQQQIGVLWIFTEPQKQYEGYHEIHRNGFVLYITENIVDISAIFGD